MNDLGIVDPETEGVVVRGHTGLAGLALMIGGLQEDLAFHYGKIWRGLNLTKKDDGWLIVLKVTDRQKHQVLFVAGRTPLEAYRNLWVVLYKGQPAWKVDNFVK